MKSAQSKQRPSVNLSNLPNSMLFQAESVQRNWLSRHGKSKFIDFSDEELAKLRMYFKELDEDGSGKSYLSAKHFRKHWYSRIGVAFDFFGFVQDTSRSEALDGPS